VQSTTRALSGNRRPRSVGAVLLALISVTAQMVALGAATGWTPGLSAAGQPKARMAAALIRSIGCGGAAAGTSTCVVGGSLHAQAAMVRVVVPTGSKQCPDSGFGASCETGQGDPLDFGAASVPAGLAPCPTDPSKPIPNALGACSATSSPAAATPDPPPATPMGSPSPRPSATSKLGETPRPQLQLSADKTTVAAGAGAVLTADSTLAVDGTPWVIEIFDQTTGALVGACSQGSRCTVAFTANAGVHTFAGFVAKPAAAVPVAGIRLTSNTVSARWLGVHLTESDPAVVGTGHAVTFTASASQDVSGSRYAIELWDTTTGQRLTYCTRGTICSTAVIEPAGGTHTVLADLGLVAPTPGLPPVLAQSASVPATWVTVTLIASTTYPAQGGVVSLRADASADLTNTPWAIYIFTAEGELVGSPCNASSCTASLTLTSGKTPSFYATIARRVESGDAASTPLAGVLQKIRVNTSKSDVQATSASVAPIRIMWGVDSCAAYTQDPAGATGLLPQVISALGAPDFWGRYLPTTGNCPGLSSAEIAAAHGHHMGILPIYNDYDCSAVSGNANGAAYGLAAVQYAQNDVIPLGAPIAIDIEPVGDACPGAGNVDYGFISGWYDVLHQAGYTPVFYGDTAPGSAFAGAWCATVQQRPDIANGSYLWSFEPSLQGGFSKANSPAFSPYYAGCPGKYVAWQYELSAGSTPDVDHDEATNQLPLWYP
jgi:glycoside hydrolase-like protein